MNKSLNAVLAGFAVATVGTTIAASPAQAFLNGSFTIDGVTQFSTDDFPMMDTITFDQEQITSSTGDFAAYPINQFNVVEVVDLGINFEAMVPSSNSAIYSYNGLVPFIEFSSDGGLTTDFAFNLDPGEELLRLVTDTGTVFNITGVTGVFTDGMTNEILGFGGLSAQGMGNGNFSIDLNTVPEPLTILGTGLALGFGTLFKKSQGAKKEQEVAKN